MLHRVALYRAQLFATVRISLETVDVARIQIFSEWPPSESCVKLGLQTAFLHAASPSWIFGRVLLPYQSVLTLPQVERRVLCFTWTEWDARRPCTFNNGAVGIKGKFVKWYALRTVLRASSRIEWEAPPRKTTSNNENMKKEESNPHDWSRNHGDTSPRCLQGNIESSSITSLQNSLRRMHLDAPCRGLLHHMPWNIRRFSARRSSCESAGELYKSSRAISDNSIMVRISLLAARISKAQNIFEADIDFSSKNALVLTAKIFYLSNNSISV